MYRWTNEKITNLALVDDSSFNFYFVISKSVDRYS